MKTLRVMAVCVFAVAWLVAAGGSSPVLADEPAHAAGAKNGASRPAAEAPDSAGATEALPPMQTLCPIMGNEIDRSVFVDYEGQRIYFCCASCVKEFSKDPAGHVAKMKAAGIRLHPVPKPQTLCPVMGEPVDRSVYTDHAGRRIYFCCQPCVKQFQKDPEKYLKLLAEQGVELEPAPAAEK